MPELRGIAYPLAIANGSLQLATDLDLVRGHILSVLETETGERVMNPAYGTPDLLFQSVQDINLIAAYIQQALEREITVATFGVTGAIADDGAAILNINWAVNGTPQPPIGFELVN